MAVCGCLCLTLSVCPSYSLSSLSASLRNLKSNIQHASAKDDYGRMTRKEKRDEPQAKTVARFRVHPCANLLARTMSKLSSKGSGTDHTAPGESLQDGAVGPSRARIYRHLLGHLLWTRSGCQIVAHRPAEHMLVLRHEAHLLPDAIRTSRTTRPTIRCRQPTSRNAAEKAPPCNFARLATDLDIPRTIRQQPVEWDVRLQVTDLQDSLRRSPHTAEDVQLFNV